MRTTQDYIIAGHRLRLVGDDLIRIVDHLDGFSPFKVDTFTESDENTVVTTIEGFTSHTSVPEPVEQLYCFTSEDEPVVQSVFGRTADGYLFTSSATDGSFQSVWCNRTGADVKICGMLDGSAMSLRMTRFALWIAFGIATAHLQTIAIHSSVISYSGKSVLFLGESGTGKSTHTRLWRENIVGARLLNDDSPIIRVLSDGRVVAYGSPWSGKTPCYVNECYPLAGCVRLSQAPYNQIRQLSVIEAYAAIHPSCPPDFAYDDNLYDGISDTINAILSCVPVYHLACLPNAEAAQLSCHTIFDN